LKKFIGLLCALTMLLSIGVAACAAPGSETVEPAEQVTADTETPAPAVEKAEPRFTPGTYTSEQMGHNGPLTV